MIYDFKCAKCQRIEEDVILSIHHTDDDHPLCCDEHMQDYITKAPYVAWEDQQLLNGGFRANHDGTVITSHKQNRDYMAKHGMVNAMDLYETPTYESEKEERAVSQASIDAITPSGEEMSMLKDSGIVDSEGTLITD